MNTSDSPGDQRVANPTRSEIERILRRAKTVAVVGASTDPAKEAHQVPAFLQRSGLRVIPINPRAEEIFGVKAYPSLAHLPPATAAEIDIVNLFRPSDQVGPHVEAAIALGTPVIWMQLGIRNEEWAAKARAAGLTVVQNTCLKVAYQRFISSSGNS